jgi:NADPH-dependent glutamate synthase beta subunit-like oxidoreductase
MSQEDTQEGQEPTPATEPNEPQAGGKTFSEEYVKQLRAENAASRRAAQEAKAKAEELEARDQSEVEKLTTKATKAERERDEAKAALLRYEVAAEKQVPAEAVDLLVGNTREELEAKADRLLELVKARETTPEFDGGTRDPAPEAKDPEAAHDDLALAILGLKPNQ